MISRFVRLSLVSLVTAAIGLSPMAVMSAEPAPAPTAAPVAAAPATAPGAESDKAAAKKAKKQAKKDKKAKKKAEKKAKKAKKAEAAQAAQQLYLISARIREGRYYQNHWSLLIPVVFVFEDHC